VQLTDTTRLITSHTDRLKFGFVVIVIVFQFLKYFCPSEWLLESFEDPADRVFKDLTLVMLSIALMTKGVGEHSEFGLNTADFLVLFTTHSY
jgi:hypothetical protein